MGGRGRRHDTAERTRILSLVDEAVGAGARQSEACGILGIDPRTVQRWRSQGVGDDMRRGPRTAPRNRLSTIEREQVLAIANSPWHRNLSPNQVWSWDITYLRTAIRGVFLHLYVVLDVWSRKIVGAEVFGEESSEHAWALIRAACSEEGIARETLVLHQDNGAPMKGATFLETLRRLGVAPSFTRPRVSDDDPYSEALVRTARYRPEYPSKPFESLETARR